MSIFKPMIAATLLFAAVSTQAYAITIIDVDGTASGNSPAFNGDGGAMVQFTLTSALTNVSIFADIVCAGCTGAAYLLTDFGPSADLSDIVAASSFDASTNPLLTSSSLAASTYYLFLSPFTGVFGWDSTQNATFTLASGASVGPSLITDVFDSNVPFQSTFQLIDQNLLFQITGDPITGNPVSSSVPEPGTWLMLILGLGAAGLVLRRQKHIGLA
ncbi:MAG: PEP-CTERM sorting domain-containing protein [Nitrospira sp.]|nr:PEP-CTERM sorting domain-containing protein [Nitrospira sp.]MBH0180197.1 PEP-CTERM sorting domain-containing protein [Nitrospira sp.]